MSRPGRLLPLSAMAGALLLAMAVGGCTVHEQVQYFAATDPDTGATNYYKMTVRGSGGLGIGDYRVQAGYFSSAAVDSG